MQTIAAFLFFYVFILSAIVLTAYVMWVCWRFFCEMRKKANGVHKEP
jgi:hypothetical protein